MQLILKAENLSVKLSEPPNEILSQICLQAKPGQILAVMGPSGSGKTTLLSALSGRIKSSGKILVNGNPLNKSLRRHICYVLQNDIFFSNLTLRQTLVYAAMLRLSKSMSHEQKMRQVDQVIESLDLKSCQHTIIGDYMRRGLSGGEKKRCSIACELLSNPSIMMLDEPTTSLDSCSAFSLVKLLKAYAIKEQKTIILTIHQPSSQIFYLFDKLLLLNRGKMMYFGECQKVLPFFQSFNYHMQHISYNPGDFLMEVAKNIDDKGLSMLSSAVLNNFADANKSNSLEKNIHTKINSPLQHQFIHPDLIKKPGHVDLTSSIHSSWSKINIYEHDYDRYSCDDDDFSQRGKKESKWPSSFATQLYALTSRNFIDGKARLLSKLNWIQTIGLALIAGTIWFQAKRTEETLIDIKGWIYFSTTYWMMFSLFNAITSFPAECQIICKERAAGSYRLSSYYIAKMIGELPLAIALPSAFHLISYPLLGYQNLYTFFGLWGFAILNALVAQSVGMFIGFTFNRLDLCITIAALYTASTSLFGGFYATTIPSWLGWLRYSSFVYFGYLNMQMIEFENGNPITCAIKNSRYASCDEFKLNNNKNYSLTELNNSEFNNKVQFVSKADILIGLDPLSPNNAPNSIWFNTLCMLTFILVFRLAGYIVLRLYHKPT